MATKSLTHPPHRQMSTTKNEQYNILSPEWLWNNPLPEGSEFQRESGNDWYPAKPATKYPSELDTIHFSYRTQRTDLPPEAYITPPTDTTGKPDPNCQRCFGFGWIQRPVEGVRCDCCPQTTGSGREGETPETDAIDATWDGNRHLRGQLSKELFKHARQLERQRDAALAQLEALRRDKESAERRAAIWMSLVHGLPTEINARFHEAAKQFDDRAAIDSAQRQEAE